MIGARHRWAAVPSSVRVVTNCDGSEIWSDGLKEAWIIMSNKLRSVVRR